MRWALNFAVSLSAIAIWRSGTQSAWALLLLCGGLAMCFDRRQFLHVLVVAAVLCVVHRPFARNYAFTHIEARPKENFSANTAKDSEMPSKARLKE